MSIAHDLRYALRLSRRTPAFTIPAAASLALGIAVNTTMFSVVNAVLLRPFGRGSGELVRIGRTQGETRGFRSATYEELQYLRRHAASFSDVMGHQIESVVLAAPGGAQIVSAELVTGNYFSVLGVPAAMGRAFTADDDRFPGERAVVVISDRFWRARFGADPGVIDRVVSVNRHPHAVIGVATPGFHGTFPGIDIDLWIPSMMMGLIAHRPDRPLPDSLTLMGRLRPGIAVRTADAEVQLLGRRMAAENPSRDRARGFIAEEARGVHPLFARVARPFLLLLMAVVGAVLLIACTNIASLLLARASARSAELAVRLAAGASRARLVRQLLVESGVIALAGGGAGLLLSVWSVRLLNAFALANGPTGTPIFLDLHLDGRVLAFTAAVTVATTLMFGLLPALQASRVDLAPLLKDSSASGGGRRRSRMRGALLVAQVACSFVLLVAAALLFRSARNTARIDLGFDPDGVVVTSFNLQMLGYDRPRADAFFAALLERARALPIAERAALSEFTPLGGRGTKVGVTIAGVTPAGSETSVAYNGVSDGYFAAIRHPLARGREFAPQDRSGPPVAIVNEAMARQYWPGEDPIGKRIRVGAGPESEIVGVARDARYGSYGADSGPFIFLPLRQYPAWLTVYVRGAAPAADRLASIERIAQELEPNAAPQDAGPMPDRMGLALLPVRVARLVFGVAGAIALLLACGGLYGLVSYSLEQRLREIGIRVALGASRRDVFHTIVGGTTRLSAAGIVIGTLIAAAATRVLQALLYGLSPTDAATFSAVALLLIVVTLVAGYAAARKGVNLEPIAVLRRD
jgi:predicted permease